VEWTYNPQFPQTQRTKNQYSDLDALPEKVAYLLKQVFTDV
jgi:hypothetical protein